MRFPELRQFYIAGFPCEHPRLHPSSQTLPLLRSDLPLRRNCLVLLRAPIDFRPMRTLVRNVMAESGTELLAVVGEQLRIVGAARDRNIGHAVVEQVFGSKFGIDMDQDAVGSLSLAGMTRDRITMIEMRMQLRIELQVAACVHL